MVPEEYTGGAVDVCAQGLSGAGGVVPEVVCTSAAVPVSVDVLEAVAKVVAETLGVVAAAGAVSARAASAASLAALT